MALVARSLVPSRAAARRAIREGRVRVDGLASPKPASSVTPESVIEVAAIVTRFVGRGGEKLATALDRFGIDVHGKRCIDVGASTGGFTDCLLQRGAAGVVAVDVGSDQLHEQLRNDPRVTSIERCDVRNVDAAHHGESDVVVVDVSFVSLGVVADALARLGHKTTEWVVLVKPQFEVGPGGRDRRGVVVEPDVRRGAVAGAIAELATAGLRLNGFMTSAVIGGSGNFEYMGWLRRGDVAHVTPRDDDGLHG